MQKIYVKRYSFDHLPESGHVHPSLSSANNSYNNLLEFLHIEQGALNGERIQITLPRMNGYKAGKKEKYNF